MADNKVTRIGRRKHLQKKLQIPRVVASLTQAKDREIRLRRLATRQAGPHQIPVRSMKICAKMYY